MLRTPLSMVFDAWKADTKKASDQKREARRQASLRAIEERKRKARSGEGVRLRQQEDEEEANAPALTRFTFRICLSGHDPVQQPRHCRAIDKQTCRRALSHLLKQQPPHECARTLMGAYGKCTTHIDLHGKRAACVDAVMEALLAAFATSDSPARCALENELSGDGRDRDRVRQGYITLVCGRGSQKLADRLKEWKRQTPHLR